MIRVSLARGRSLPAICAAILPVSGRSALAAVILRILLIGPLLILILRLLVLVRPLLILIGSLLNLPLLILVLALLVGVGARRILDLAGRALPNTCARTILTESRPHGRTGTEFSSPLTVEACRGQTENEGRSGGQAETQDRSGGQTERQDRSGGRGRWTLSFRVPGPVHKSFSQL